LLAPLALPSWPHPPAATPQHRLHPRREQGRTRPTACTATGVCTSTRVWSSPCRRVATPPLAAKGAGEDPASGREGSRGRSSLHRSLVPTTSMRQTSMHAGQGRTSALHLRPPLPPWPRGGTGEEGAVGSASLKGRRVVAPSRPGHRLQPPHLHAGELKPPPWGKLHPATAMGEALPRHRLGSRRGEGDAPSGGRVIGEGPTPCFASDLAARPCSRPPLPPATMTRWRGGFEREKGEGDGCGGGRGGGEKGGERLVGPVCG
jgi:hypothetical protein